MQFELKKTAEGSSTLVEFLSQHSPLSKSAIKKALAFGGAWLQKNGRGARCRCRRATKVIAKGDKIFFYFDDRLYQTVSLEPECLLQTPHWGIWYKPSNVVAQGSPFGDMGSMEQLVTQYCGHKSAYLIHRLDREASGLMVFAYNKNAAAKLSELWRGSQVKKTYQAEILGHLDCASGTITKALDEKPSTTHYSVHHTNPHTSLVEVHIDTGRYHQIRRHFAAIDHPLMGDPKYGQNNKNKQGLQLVASNIAFTCPLTQQYVDFALPKNKCLFAQNPLCTNTAN